MIGIFAHSEKPAARAVVQAMTSGLAQAGVPFLIERETASLAGLESDLDEAALAERCELLVVMGGDGTILRVVHKIRATLPPIFGINIGSLGFLTCLGPSEVHRAVESLRDKDYILSPRRLIDVRLERSSGEVRRFQALNDAVVGRGERSELVRIRVAIDGEVLTEYNADGLIIATPTGSTAYSLSAGGPILMPDSGSFVITPICPHVLTNRSVVVSDSSNIEIALSEAGQNVFVNVDGQETCEMGVGDVLSLSKSDRSLPLAMLPERSFSEVLRQKLKWSGSNL
ncbi:MAG: NAD(+)/NADH kinase [Terrimicrobiaceae bacterium]|jgi:NAD+ kinase